MPVIPRQRWLLEGSAILLINLLLLELLLQFLYWFTSGGGWLAARVSPPIYADNPALGIYGLRPGFAYRHTTNEFSVPIVIDGRGMRVNRQPTSATAHDQVQNRSVLTVVGSGPSYGFGWGSDNQDSYYSRMARLLAERLQLPVRLLNISVPSQSSGLQLCRLQLEMAKDRPGLVMITVYGGLQNLEPLCRRSSSLQVWNHQLVTGRPTLLSRTKALLRQSATVFYAYALFGLLAGQNARTVPMGQQDYRPLTGVDPQRQIEAYAAAVRRSLGPVPLLFVRVPLAYEIHPAHWARWRSNASPQVLQSQAATDAAGWRALQMVQPSLQRQGIYLLDPMALLRSRAAKGQALYYRLDTHFTPVGNAVVAEALARDPALPSLLQDVRRHRSAVSAPSARRPPAHQQP